MVTVYVDLIAFLSEHIPSVVVIDDFRWIYNTRVSPFAPVAARANNKVNSRFDRLLFEFSRFCHFRLT